jgi:hypothetical protein
MKTFPSTPTFISSPVQTKCFSNFTPLAFHFTPQNIKLYEIQKELQTGRDWK